MSHHPSMTRAEILRSDRENLWHPFADMARWEREDPPVIRSGEGVWLTDMNGHRMLDGTASLWVNLLGHRRPELDRALLDQAGLIAHSTFLGATHEGAVLLGEKLLSLAPPGLSRVFYSDNGSTAVEIAMKLAFLAAKHRAKKRGQSPPSRFLSLERGYHGDTLGAVGAGAIERFHAVFGPLVRPSITAPAPDCAHCPLGLVRPGCDLACADVAIDRIRAHRDELVAVLVEPLLQAAGGMIVWPKGYLARLAQGARSEGILFVADEVATGFGRTGTLFACEQEGVIPDLLVVGKALTGGYLPLAATLCTERIYRAVREDPGTFYHGHSYTANPLACRVALATLEVLEREKLLASIPEKRARIEREWGPLSRHPGVRNIRTLGLVAAFDLGPPSPGSAFANGGAALLEWTRRIGERARERGLLIRPLGPTLYLIPALSATVEECGLMARILRETVESALSTSP